ncbi:trimeric intracellular cation channel type 1B.1-like [Rhopilema esculentum]|uniref:trimeric intracellular cation channel type 1B.1-like n=1 Tax=Rhopilema esculentum TaxID=499914 RepID=UPI0031D8CBF0
MDFDVKEAISNFLKHTSDVHSFGNYVENVPIYPLFLGVHCVLVAGALRTRDGSKEFAKHHPLTSWFVSVVSCYGGTIIQNFLLAQPILAALKNEQILILGTIAWYLVFFSPGDFFWEALQLKIFKAILVMLKELHRLRMIINGIAVGTSLHPSTPLIIIINGAIRGNGAKFLMKPLDHFVRGGMVSSFELLAPHFSTKSSVVISALLWNHTVKFVDIPISREALLVYILLFMVCMQLSFVLFEAGDPYLYLESAACHLFLTLPSELSLRVRKSKME